MEIFEETMALDADGNVAAPDRPGLGITSNYEQLKQYRVGWASAGWSGGGIARLVLAR